MNLPFNLISKYQDRLSKLALVVLALSSLFSLFYFIPSYLKTNSSGFHGGGYDFLAYYSAGKIASEGRVADIYNDKSLSQIQNNLVPNIYEAQGYMAFLNPPYFAFTLAPLSIFNIGTAQILWLLISLTLALTVSYLITKKVDKNARYKVIIFFISITTFPLWQNYRQGQLGILLLFFAVLGVLQYQKNKQYQAGALLSILFLKPHIALLVLIGLFIFNKRKVMLGMIVSFILTVLIFLPFTGIKIYAQYAKNITGIAVSHTNGAGTVTPGLWEGSLSRTYGINGSFTKLFGQENYVLVNLFTIATLLTLLWLIAHSIFKIKALESKDTRKYLILVMLIFAYLLNPHLYAYDLVYILAVILLIHPRKIPMNFILTILFILQLSAIDYITYIPVFTFTLIVTMAIIYKNRLLNHKDAVVTT